MDVQTPLVLHVFSTFAAGGPQVRTVQLIDALGGEFRHLIHAMDGRYGAMDLLQNPQLAERAPPLPEGGTIWRRIRGYRRWLKERQADVLATYNWGAIEVAAAASFMRGLRHIHHEEGFGPEEASRQLKRRVLFRRLALRRAEAIVVPSQKLRILALDKWRLPEKKVQLIENGVDIAAFGETKPDVIPGFTKRSDEITIGTLAGLRPEKNLGLLVRAFAALKTPAKLVIVGEGPERALIKAEAQRLGVLDKLVLPGFIARPQDYLGLFDIFALSSKTEQFPISLVEAMAAGRPVVATDVGDIRAVLPEEQQDFVAGSVDEQGLASALQCLADDENLRRKLGELNKLRVAAHYGFNKTVAAYKALYLGA